jgi:hypothetical protein
MVGALYPHRHEWRFPSPVDPLLKTAGVLEGDARQVVS